MNQISWNSSVNWTIFNARVKIFMKLREESFVFNFLPSRSRAIMLSMFNLSVSVTLMPCPKTFAEFIQRESYLCKYFWAVDAEKKSKMFVIETDFLKIGLTTNLAPVQNGRSRNRWRASDVTPSGPLKSRKKYKS